MELKDRLREALALSGKTRSQLAQEIGVTGPAISQWLSGTIKSLKASTAAKIEAATGVRAAWIAEGSGPQFVVDAPEVPPAKRRVPLVARIHAGDWCEIPEPYCAASLDWLVADADVSANAYALEIDDESMQPEFRPGDRVIFDPDVAPRPGDVVASRGLTGAAIGRYRLRANDNGVTVYELAPCNHDYQTIRCTSTDSRIVGVVVEHRSYRRR